MSKEHTAARQSGFTLLETLVVVIVLGMLVAGLGQGVHAGLSLWGAQQRRLGEIAELDAGARVLRSLLTGIVISQGQGVGGPDANAGFKGDAEHVSFIGDLPTGLGNTRRSDITIGLRNGNVVLTWTPHLHEIPLTPAPPPIHTEVVGHVARLEIAYWGSAAPDQAAAWQARWDGPAPPQLIRIRLVFGKGDARRWPVLIAAPIL